MSEGVAFCMGACFGCKRTFCFDPQSVPSLAIDPVTGKTPDLGGDPGRAVRQPLCPDCCKAANIERAKVGLPLFPEGDSMDNVQEGNWHALG